MRRFATVGMMLLTAGLTTAAVGLATVGGGKETPQVDRKSPPRSDPAGVRVRLIDLDGKPVAGIAVEVRNGDLPGSFATDADGLATIPRAVVGEHGFLIARRGDSLAWAWPEDPIRLHEAKNGPLTMQLLPIDHRVEGQIIDRGKRPLAGVRLSRYLLAHKVNNTILFGQGSLDAILPPVVTDDDGNYAMRLPRDSFVYYGVEHPGYVHQSIYVNPDSRVLATITLEPPGLIAGRVIEATTGRPITGARVYADLIEYPTDIFGEWVDATTDEKGHFLISGLQEGVYNLILAGIPGRPSATAVAVEGVRVRAGAETSADLVAIEGRQIRGVVLDRDTGKPVPHVNVGCNGPARPWSMGECLADETDERGRFTFFVPPGEQYVYCMGRSGHSRLDHRDISIPDRGEVEPIRLLMRSREPMPRMPSDAVAKADVPQVAPAPAAAVGPNPGPAPETRTVTGHIRDPQGRPMAGVRVGFQDVSASTDRDGLFIFPGLPRGPVEITMSRARHRDQSVNLSADRESVEWTFTPIPDPRQSSPPKAFDEPIPADLRDRLTFVDLDPTGNDYLADGPGGPFGPLGDLNRLPRGIHRMGDTFFRIGQKMVHLKGRERPELPASVKGIAVGARGRSLHFLHSTQGGADVDGKIAAVYVIHYADGTHEQAPVVYGCDITNWLHRDPGRPISRAIPAWTGPNDATERHSRPGLMVRLFEMSWANPHPEKEIASLDFLSKGEECDPFLVAVTLERD